MATKNTRPYIAERMPVSRTRAARPANVSISSWARPNSLTSCAPATLNRSVICAFISAFVDMFSRLIACSRRPTRLAGTTNSGSTIRAINVSCHCRANIASSVVINTMMLLTTLPSVLVTAVCAPTTSLFSRLVSAPVCVRVKKAIGIRCTLANRATRRS